MVFIRKILGTQRLDKRTLPLGGPNGLSPNVKILDHHLFGSIITSKYSIIRFYQDGLPICYNAALAMYMYSTQPVGTNYTEMAYHDNGRTDNYNYHIFAKEGTLAYLTNVLARKTAQVKAEAEYQNRFPELFIYSESSDRPDSKIDQAINRDYKMILDREDPYKNGQSFRYGIKDRNMRENGLVDKAFGHNEGRCPNPRASFFNRMVYIQTFERILSYGPVIAGGIIDERTFPHYSYRGGHAYLVYGIFKYIDLNNNIDAVLVCVDPNYPEHDMLIPILAFADQERISIASKDKSQLRHNTETVDWRESDLRQLPMMEKGFLDTTKVHAFYRYNTGYNPRRVGSMTQKGYYTKRHKVVR
jgi:hypothetical protein